MLDGVPGDEEGEQEGGDGGGGEDGGREEHDKCNSNCREVTTSIF